MTGKAFVFDIGMTRYIERGVIEPDEWTKVKRSIALEQHREIMGRANKADEDPQVNWDYRKDWRQAPLPVGEVFGSDYDYWAYVVEDAFALWHRHARSIFDDFIAESIAGQEPGWSKGFYAAGFEVWQNGVKAARGQRLDGPRVDVGPTADFAAFLERWSYSKTRNAGPVRLYQTIGVLNFIARELALRYVGVHTIFMMPIRPESRADVRELEGRTRPVETFPIIRIAPRHYRRPRL